MLAHSKDWAFLCELEGMNVMWMFFCEFGLAYSYCRSSIKTEAERQQLTAHQHETIFTSRLILQAIPYKWLDFMGSAGECLLECVCALMLVSVMCLWSRGEGEEVVMEESKREKNPHLFKKGGFTALKPLAVSLPLRYPISSSPSSLSLPFSYSFIRP